MLWKNQSPVSQRSGTNSECTIPLQLKKQMSFFWAKKSQLFSTGLIAAMFQDRIHSNIIHQKLWPQKKIPGPFRADFQAQNDTRNRRSLSLFVKW